MATAKSEVHLQAMLDDVSPIAFRLLKWVLQAGRMNMALIPEQRQIPGMGTTLQFQVVTTQPEKECQFQEWRRQSRNHGNKKGSFIAFHGSSIANWHSILRTGLRGGPGAVGTGVYMADQLKYSIPYMDLTGKVNRSWKNSVLGCNGKFNAISLVECSDMRHDKALLYSTKPRDGFPNHVAVDETLVVPR